MNKPVSLREIVGTKTVYALMLTAYYWMWARKDWQSYYSTVQMGLGVFLMAFFFIQGHRTRRYKRESVDELAEQNLRRCDSICLRLLLAALIPLAWVCAVVGHTGALGAEVLGWVIVLSILALSVLRTALFCRMDRKGA